MKGYIIEFQSEYYSSVITVAAESKEQLENKLSTHYEDNVSILFIDIIDMTYRDHNAKVTIGGNKFYATINRTEIIL